MSFLVRTLLCLLVVLVNNDVANAELYIPSVLSNSGSTKPTRGTVRAANTPQPDVVTTSEDGERDENNEDEHDIRDEEDVMDSEQLPWQWDITVADQLLPWEKIDKDKVDLAEKRVQNAVTAFRAQVIDGRLFISDIRALWFARQYTASAKLTLLAVLRNFKDQIPNLDIVINQGDYPVVLPPRNAEHLKRLYDDTPYPIIFSPTSSATTYDLMWPDFSFMPPNGEHELRTPRWDIERQNVLKAGREIRWEDKLDFAAFTGNTQAGPRQVLAQVARENPDELLVNAIFFKTDTGRLSCEQEGLGNVGGLQEQKCSMSFSELCRYRYLVNVGSNGYANKLKYLFLCNSVVIFVRDGSPNSEFFQSQLIPGTHYYAVNTMADVPSAVKYLRANPKIARTIAQTGTKRMSQLSFYEVTRYLATLLKAYAKRLSYEVVRDPRSFEVNCEDDLWRHYIVHTAEVPKFLTQDNASCLVPPQKKEIVPPGWGGSWRGGSVACETAHDLTAQPDACDHPTDKCKRRERCP